MFEDEGIPAAVRDAAREVGSELKLDLLALAQDETALNRTEIAQPALLAAGVGTWRAWIASGGPAAAAMAGHSLGEYAALVCAEKLELAAAARLVGERARAMQAAVPEGAGRMDAVLGLAPDQVAATCPPDGDAWVANLNSPQQVVIAGTAGAVAQAAAACQAAGAKRVVQLPVSVPSHCPLMEPAQAALQEALRDVSFQEGSVPVIHNATAAPATDAATAAANLSEQLIAPVDWIACVGALLEHASVLLECGPKKVLTGLNRRIAPDASCHNIDSDASIAALLEGS